MSVGLGNVWRFPYTAYKNGGGAFLIPYLVVLIAIGRPLYFLELAIGQFSSSNGVKVWNAVPAFRGVGYGQAIATASVVSYYTSLIALALYYFSASFSSVLPWVVCDPSLGNPNVTCIDSGRNVTEVMINISLDRDIDLSDVPKAISSAEQYFLYEVLKVKRDISDGIGFPDWKLTLCLAACYLMLFLTLWKGVAGSGKVAYFTALFPYVVLITLLIKGCTLPGAMKGILYYVTPQWDQLLNIQVWYAAVTQSFFSLSVGFGAIITYSSYNGFRHNTYRDALIISITDTFTSMLAGLTIFSILGNLAEELNVDISEVIQDGTSLAFISYPRALGQFDYLPQLFSALFFLMLITLGLGSATGLLSGLIAIFCDQRPEADKTKITFFVCLGGFFIGLVYITQGGQQILTLVDFFGGGFIIFALAILEVVGVCWIYGIRRLIGDIKFMLNIDIGWYWKFCWVFFIPIALTGILAYSIYTDFIVNTEPLKYGGIALPDEAIYAGYALTALACIQVPYWLLHTSFLQKGETCTEKLSKIWKPNEEWGPSNAKDRIDWIGYQAQEQFEKVLNYE